MLKLTELMENSNPNLYSFKVLKDIAFYKQLSDFEFQKTEIIAKKEEVYDGIIVLKRNNNYYINVGWDTKSFCDLYIPIETNKRVNIKLMK